MQLHFTGVDFVGANGRQYNGVGETPLKSVYSAISNLAHVRHLSDLIIAELGVEFAWVPTHPGYQFHMTLINIWDKEAQDALGQAHIPHLKDPEYSFGSQVVDGMAFIHITIGKDIP